MNFYLKVILVLAVVGIALGINYRLPSVSGLQDYPSVVEYKIYPLLDVGNSQSILLKEVLKQNVVFNPPIKFPMLDE